MQLTSRTLFSFVPFSVRSFFCFSLLFLNTHTDKKEANSSAMEAAALALYDAINPVLMAKFESGEFTTEEEANAFGNKITAAVASACEGADETTSRRCLRPSLTTATRRNIWRHHHQDHLEYAYVGAAAFKWVFGRIRALG